MTGQHRLVRALAPLVSLLLHFLSKTTAAQQSISIPRIVFKNTKCITRRNRAIRSWIIYLKRLKFNKGYIKVINEQAKNLFLVCALRLPLFAQKN